MDESSLETAATAGQMEERSLLFSLVPGGFQLARLPSILVMLTGQKALAPSLIHSQDRAGGTGELVGHRAPDRLKKQYL